MPFKNLPREVVTLIVDKFVMGLETQLEDRGVTIQLTQRAKDKLAKDGYDPQNGRASAGSFDSRKDQKAFADALLFGELQNGGLVEIDFVDGDFIFDYPQSKIEDGSASIKKLEGPTESA